MNEFSDFFVVECNTVNDREFVLIFKYRDTMMKALRQIKSCEMKVVQNQSEAVTSDIYTQVKRQLGLQGKQYESGTGYRDMPSLEELEELINQKLK